ncbi:gibberellin 2-beta-dioxygenase 1 [Lactuca sativa]|uniref:gibberellin 2-beta-dioxygenase 1 n=1 Tax=Lactuca sativa TaxID=4236 RepID=UPI000CB11355|nr:gibberellin 2-beta-dioxygenase 1 [Lactuca sativa]
MVAISKPPLEQLFVKPCKPNNNNSPSFPTIPLIDLSKSESKQLLVKACQDFGFFKVVNHGVPMKLISKLESEAVKFFSSPLSVKQKAGPPNPFGYGNKLLGQNGDFGWVEYLLLNAKLDSDNKNPTLSFFEEHPEKFQSLVNDYVTAVKKMACDILELLADELKLQQRNVFSKLLMDEESDSVFRLNYYPPCPELQEHEPKGRKLIGFGEHTDPQIISVLRSNNTSGLEISLRDGSWMSVPPDSNSFFINVGDSLQVMTNGRFKSVKHRVVANSVKSRMSMIYFGGPPLSEKIAPLPSLMEREEASLYKEFTWFEYKKSAFNSRLSDNRLGRFEKKNLVVLS